jgi:hypothetical protein
VANVPPLNAGHHDAGRSIQGGMRFDQHADDRAGAIRYLRERAHQTLIDGFHPLGEIEILASGGVEWGVRGLARNGDGLVHQSIYVYASQRGQGRFARAAAGGPPVVTTPGCQLEPFLIAKGIPHAVAARITGTPEYLAIEREYGTRAARRTGVLFMHHIDEGLAVLQRMGAPEPEMRAYCIHPLFQAGADQELHADLLGMQISPHVLELAIEFCRVANASLATRVIASSADIPLSPVDGVNRMLIADKVQNRKDFLLHHRGSHPRSDALDRYFVLWLERLSVDQARFAELFEDLQVTPAPIRLADL